MQLHSDWLSARYFDFQNCNFTSAFSVDVDLLKTRFVENRLTKTHQDLILDLSGDWLPPGLATGHEY